MDLKPELKQCDTGETVLPYLEFPGQGPPLLMLHATGFLPWLWEPAARELAAEYRIIAPFFYKHRKPDPDTGAVSWELLARDIAGLCRKLNLERPFLTGHSMGGAVSTLASTLFGVDPSAMVLIEPILLPEFVYSLPMTVEQHPLASKSIKRRNHWKDRLEAEEYLQANPFFLSWNPEVLGLYARRGIVENSQGGLTLDCQPEMEAALFLGSNKRNPWPLLNQIACPVLIMEGEISENRNHIDLSGALTLIPNCRGVLVEGAGHLIPMEQPRETAAMIRDFFAQAGA